MDPVVELGSVDCDKVFLCADNHRQCSEAGCGVSGDWAELSLRRVGEELIGVISGATFSNERKLRLPLGRVRFTLED